MRVCLSVCMYVTIVCGMCCRGLAAVAADLSMTKTRTLKEKWTDKESDAAISHLELSNIRDKSIPKWCLRGVPEEGEICRTFRSVTYLV